MTDREKVQQALASLEHIEWGLYGRCDFCLNHHKAGHHDPDCYFGRALTLLKEVLEKEKPL